ncbi:MAG TPA: AAA domain-containing protein [Pseudonocardiaceae bacterium]|nr:AAA domain-containing protein [Pseudonocardiaceae bacterium]
MLDPRREALLIEDERTLQLIDKTSDVARYEAPIGGGRIGIVFKHSPKIYYHKPSRVMILRDPVRVGLADGMRVEVRGAIWDSVTEVWTFAGPTATWSRIFYTRGRAAEKVYRTYPAEQVQLIPNMARTAGVAEVLGYWRDVAYRLAADDPLRRAYDQMGFVHPESVLGHYLGGAPIEHRGPTLAPIFPFRCNLSQREAVDNALCRSISVIQGPPGTGKTETILNLVANIVVARDRTVGVVSSNNAAVDNVREKLDESSFGYVIASLGRRERREKFLAEQASRNAQVTRETMGVPGRSPSPQQIADLAGRLRGLQRDERQRAELQGELDAYRLELRHFDWHLGRQELPDLEGLPLLRRSADRILDYLAESELEREGVRSGLIGRIRKYFRYGSMRGLNPDDTDVVLRLQREYYDKRIGELTGRVQQLDDELRRADFASLAEEHRRLSVDALRASLNARYRELSRTTYSATYKQGSTFASFTRDYPVVLSTCHALLDSIADGYLLDYLVIDEASQVSLLAAGLAMSCCRNLVVVGDLRQLPQIDSDAAEGLEPPGPAYDCRRHNILSSLLELYPDLPRTLLREHYRCDPAIIGFCNKAFYDGELIPYTVAGAEQPMVVAPTVAGNHMRLHRGGGRSNQREVDVIINEVIPTYCPDVAGTDIGITTPYRRQVDRVADSLIDQIEADTVHKFQGRQRAVVILTTVLDETWRGRTGLKFADDPHLINVAVSRAVRRFILVTNNDMLPTSRHIRDLVDYIRYQNPGEKVVESAVVSVFDLLYRDYSPRLRPLAARLKNEMAYKSEDIVWTVLHDILAEERYAHLVAGYQVLLRNLLFGVNELTTRQEAYVRHRASVDFVVYNRVSNRPVLAIEVDGFAYHEDNPAQLARDAIKKEILQARGLPLLRLPTTGSGEDGRIRKALDDVEDSVIAGSRT